MKTKVECERPGTGQQRMETKRECDQGPQRTQTRQWEMETKRRCGPSRSGMGWKKKAIHGWKPKETAGYWETKPKGDEGRYKEMEFRPEYKPTVCRNYGGMHSYRILGTSSTYVGHIQAVGSHMVLETIRRCESTVYGNQEKMRAR